MEGKEIENVIKNHNKQRSIWRIGGSVWQRL
jgi:hypothetical protein